MQRLHPDEDIKPLLEVLLDVQLAERQLDEGQGIPHEKVKAQLLLTAK